MRCVKRSVVGSSSARRTRIGPAVSGSKPPCAPGSETRFEGSSWGAMPARRRKVARIAGYRPRGRPLKGIAQGPGPGPVSQVSVLAERDVAAQGPGTQARGARALAEFELHAGAVLVLDRFRTEAVRDFAARRREIEVAIGRPGQIEIDVAAHGLPF